MESKNDDRSQIKEIDKPESTKEPTLTYKAAKDIMWTVKFRNGNSKVFRFPVS